MLGISAIANETFDDGSQPSTPPPSSSPLHLPTRGGGRIDLPGTLERAGISFKIKDSSDDHFKVEDWVELFELEGCPFHPDQGHHQVVVGRRKTSTATRMMFRCRHPDCSDKRWADFKRWLADRGALLGEGLEPEVGLPKELEGQLNLGKHGKIPATLGNLYKILLLDPEAPLFWMNLFTNNIVVVEEDGKERVLSDQDVIGLQIWAEERYGGVAFSRNTAFWAIEKVAAVRGRNPLVDWLNSLRWDGKLRLTTWIVDYTGCEDTEINRVMGRKFLIGGVARALNPGCEMHTTLILVGRQGAGKDQLFTALFGREYLDSTRTSMKTKDFYMHLAGCWAHNLAELSALKTADAEAVKQLLVGSKDTYRPPYGRTEVTNPRHCVFVGSSNRFDFLDDPTGARRFWPIAVGNFVDPVGVEEIRDQLWAEAVAAYRAGEQWWLTPPEEELHREAVRAFEDEDVLTAPVLQFVGQRQELSIHEIIKHLELSDEWRGERKKDRRIAAILTRAGFWQERYMRGGRKLTVWVKRPL